MGIEKGYTPKTRGSIRSWQYDFAVSWIANSSSVNSLLESNGSSQLKTLGAWAHLLVVRMVGLEAATLVRGCLYIFERSS